MGFGDPDAAAFVEGEGDGLVEVGFRGDELTSDTIETPVTGLGTSIGGSVTFEANGHEFLVGYGIDEPGVGSYARLRRKTYSPLIPVSATGLGCASTQIGWFGQRHIGNETCGVTFANAPLNSFTVVLIASGTEAVQLNGIDGVHDGCWLLVPIDGPGYFFMLDPILATGGQWSLPLPEDLPNMTLRFQGLTFDATLGEFFTTNRINVPVGK